MLTDQKGGLYIYRVIKDEVTTMVANLSTGTLFNVVFFYDGRQLFFKPRLVPAGSEITQELIQWIAPINRDANSLGLPGAQRLSLTAMAEDPIHAALPRASRWASQENAYLTQIFLEQSIDAIFWITGYHQGFQRLLRPPHRKRTGRLGA